MFAGRDEKEALAHYDPSAYSLDKDPSKWTVRTIYTTTEHRARKIELLGYRISVVSDDMPKKIKQNPCVKII